MPMPWEQLPTIHNEHRDTATPCYHGCRPRSRCFFSATFNWDLIIGDGLPAYLIPYTLWTVIVDLLQMLRFYHFLFAIRSPLTLITIPMNASKISRSHIFLFPLLFAPSSEFSMIQRMFNLTKFVLSVG